MTTPVSQTVTINAPPNRTHSASTSGAACTTRVVPVASDGPEASAKSPPAGNSVPREGECSETSKRS
ncbi:hypothetical protein SGFS_000550 [Streptomyces graminofaciens]|uniref:Uncharacterized protein n=1 Tax=Streptomyces graminofaciens TaxID=68212 RepID=A0ABN5V753_9ACTN|nr:hypothetical protein SGFS_000550 [Streptomyces graminofaciens]